MDEVTNPALLPEGMRFGKRYEVPGVPGWEMAAAVGWTHSPEANRKVFHTLILFYRDRKKLDFPYVDLLQTSDYITAEITFSKSANDRGIPDTVFCNKDRLDGYVVVPDPVNTALAYVIAAVQMGLERGTWFGSNDRD